MSIGLIVAVSVLGMLEIMADVALFRERRREKSDKKGERR